MEAFCISIVKKIKDAFGWSGEIMAESSVGAWTGDLPIYLRVDKANHSGEDISNGTALLQRSDEEKKTSTQDIASYQVLFFYSQLIFSYLCFASYPKEREREKRGNKKERKSYRCSFGTKIPSA